ncbi:hypothetical protein CAPTEDRAFT_107099 [Capitella teleta]|uniref:Rab-GAP TBC domain-containing protein n=1 Tax=Capitella teleta TaxID=283909 RepID=R7TSP9_CAPTE|nr:hypothetical protein CAPTEDRAFT_107099 [Capitella teleta]|eukprot:ELT96632.1 hypothetical protein CAPTEDRAFT_107099 [Capitella teleta]
MGPNLDETVRILSYLFPLIGCANKDLRRFIESTQVSNIFSLSWLMTWFSHVLNNFKDILRLYDFFLASHPYMPIYLAAATVLHRENEILACDPDEMFVHPLLAKIPDNVPWELLCSRAQNLFVLHPPQEVAAEANKCYELYVSSLSVSDSHVVISLTRTQQRKRPMPSKRMERPISCQMWLWIKARSYSSRGILYHVTVWTLLAAVTAAAYTFYVGQSLEDIDDSVKVSLSNAR